MKIYGSLKSAIALSNAETTLLTIALGSIISGYVSRQEGRWGVWYCWRRVKITESESGCWGEGGEE